MANLLIGAFFAHQPWSAQQMVRQRGRESALPRLGSVSRKDNDVAIPMKVLLLFNNMKYPGRQRER